MIWYSMNPLKKEYYPLDLINGDFLKNVALQNF